MLPLGRKKRGVGVHGVARFDCALARTERRTWRSFVGRDGRDVAWSSFAGCAGASSRRSGCWCSCSPSTSRAFERRRREIRRECRRASRGRGPQHVWVVSPTVHDSFVLAIDPLPSTLPSTATTTPGLFKMPAGVALSTDLRNCLIYMHTTSCLDGKAISQLTGIPLRTVYRILSVWRSTGEVKPQQVGKPGRPRALDFANTQVCRDHQRLPLCS